MHRENSFITLTYSDEKIPKDHRLHYEDFQKFMKRLRRAYPNKEIGVFVTGEYGDQTKRPHWHACIFGYNPTDLSYLYSNERGDKVYSSQSLDRIWGNGSTKIGSLTLESAGYCARYAAKKLTHGRDQEHDFHPVSKKSSKNAIGKRYIEKYWDSTFALGQIVLPDGQTCSIPRYYEKWLQKHQPAGWEKFIKGRKQTTIDSALQTSQREKEAYDKQIKELAPFSEVPITRNESRAIILEQKFQKLQKHLKL